MRARTRDRMLALVRRWETSGETRRAFAQRHGVTLSCFDFWRRQALDARQDVAVTQKRTTSACQKCPTL